MNILPCDKTDMGNISYLRLLARYAGAFCIFSAIFILCGWFIDPQNFNIVSKTELVADESPKAKGIVFQSLQFNTDACDVACTTGVPCEYKDELDFRIVLITYNRPDSLRKCLNHVSGIDTLGDRVGVDIWIDRSRVNNSVDQRTLSVANSFARTWIKGRACVHIQSRNAYIIGQWIDTWRPKVGTNEMALILEDDIDVSPLVYKWLKTIKGHFQGKDGISGYGLQMENLKTERGKRVVMNAPKSDVLFLYRMFGPWGFSPEPRFWRHFQDWFHEIRKNETFHPYIPDILHTAWYKGFEKKGRPDSMWEQWFIYFCDLHDMFTVHSNLAVFSNKTNVLLDTNRRENGLHFKNEAKSWSRKNKRKLLIEWEQRFEQLPAKVRKYDYDGKELP